jgi:thermitase
MTKYIVLLLPILFAAAQSFASSTSSVTSSDMLVKFVSGTNLRNLHTLQSLQANGNKVEILSDSWVRIHSTGLKTSRLTVSSLNADPNVEFVQPNYPIHFLESYKIQDPLKLAAYLKGVMKDEIPPSNAPPAPFVKPDLPLAPAAQLEGEDPLLQNQWGMLDIGVKDAWKVSRGDSKMIVAVIDSGVDYTHEDLSPNLWRNPGESGIDAHGNAKEKNGIDDDANGFIDDVVGWDFVTNDNKPYDIPTPWTSLIAGDGNPGHGTHCAGTIGARGGNAIGISGVAPNTRIMILRFISEKGQGDTASAVKAIKYAVDNGAKVLSNSWGSEGEDSSDGAENKALKDIIQYAQDKGVLFIAAAGNGHKGVGYDNDTDPKPAYPASYSNENIMSVAALDNTDQLGAFSNWGLKTVHIGAPGVDIFSSMVGNKYGDNVLDVQGILQATWDGTSMAAPHVAGAAALYWSANPTKTWKEVKAAILISAKKIPALSGKTVSEGKLDVKELMNIR